MKARKLHLPHPGAILRVEFFEPLQLTAYRVAKELAIPTPRLNDILLEKRGISAEMGVLLALYFGTSSDFFVNLQCDYDRRIAERKLGGKLRQLRTLKSYGSRRA